MILPAPRCEMWEKLNQGVSRAGVSHFFSGKVRIVSRTLSGVFLVGAVHRPRRRKRIDRENPGQIGKIPPKNWEGPKKYNKRQIGTDESRSGSPPPV